MKARIQKSMNRMGYEMMIFTENTNHVLQTDFYTMDEQGPGASIDPEKHIHYIPDEVFEAIKDAIHKDFKPSEGKFTEGKLEAMGDHLEDMRKLVFKKK